MTVRAPFSPTQVKRLNAYQAYGSFHQFTCPVPHPQTRVLIAVTAGWVCPSCDFTQDWAHDFQVDERWEKGL